MSKQSSYAGDNHRWLRFVPARRATRRGAGLALSAMLAPMRLPLAALLVLGGCAHAAGKTPASEPLLAAEQVVAVSVSAPPSLRPGEHGEIVVTLRIARGYHVMSDRPSRPAFIATRVQFAPSPGFVWSAARYPPVQRFALGDEAIATFEGEVVVRVPFAVDPSASVGARALSAELSYQACTHTSCLFPVRRALAATPIEIRP